MNVRSIQADRKLFPRFGGMAFGGPSAANRSTRSTRSTRSMLRPAFGTEAVSRYIASPYEALPGPFRFADAGTTVAKVLPDGITEQMRAG